MPDVLMPKLSDSMQEGTILKWLKADGDEIERGDELVEIETDKANMTYEADQAGILTILAREGETLSVGTAIARIGDRSGNGAAGRPIAGSISELATTTQPPASLADPPTVEITRSAQIEAAAAGTQLRASDTQDGRVNASPVARRVARVLGLSLVGLTGSGPRGRILKADVKAAATVAAHRREAPPQDTGEARV